MGGAGDGGGCAGKWEGGGGIVKALICGFANRVICTAQKLFIFKAFVV